MGRLACRIEARAEQPCCKQSANQAVRRTSAAGTRDAVVSVPSVSCPHLYSWSFLVSGFQSGFSAGLETRTPVAFQPMLSLCFVTVRSQRGVGSSSALVGKVPRNKWPKLDGWSGAGQDTALPSLQCMESREEPLQEPAYFHNHSSQTSTRSGRKDSTSI